MLSMGGGVSFAIGSMAGQSIRQEVAADLPLSVGTVAVTSGGRLPVKYILHAVTIDLTHRIIPTARTVRHLYRDILSRCEALQIERIAIPALATGAAGVDPLTSSKQLARAIHEHTSNRTVLKSIVLPIPDPEVFDLFVAALFEPEDNPFRSAGGAHSGDSPESAPGSSGDSGRLRGVGDGAVSPYGATNQPERSLRARFSRFWRATPSSDVQSTQPPLIDRSLRPDGVAELPIESQTSRPLLGGRYVLLEEIGRGGMAVVHLAWDLVLRHIVAIKILRADCADPQSLQREAALAFELTHAGIVRLYHFEPARARRDAYLVMEYLSWPSGEKWIADSGESGLPVRAVQEVGIRVCDALAYAHSHNVLHLDIKPSNIFVDPAGESAKLGDFGLARISGTGGAALQVRPIGTPAYMAPEQIAVGAKVTTSTDVYQMAATLWDFLTGSPPKPLATATALMASERQPLLAALRQALSPEPNRRPSAAHLRQLIIAAAVA
jgi:O-acetyl-ADP-ribose deacetylase (regulator of RNase III)